MSEGSAFLGPLDLRLWGPGRWVLLRDFPYRSDLMGRVLTVPEGFITDLASVPRLPLAYLIAGSRFPAPAVVHDYLYQHPDFEDRALVDAVLYEATGVATPIYGIEREVAIIRSLVWRAVRIGGWRPWNSRRPEKLNPIWTATGWPAASTQSP